MTHFRASRRRGDRAWPADRALDRHVDGVWAGAFDIAAFELAALRY
jgi:hypothetical protein